MDSEVLGYYLKESGAQKMYETLQQPQKQEVQKAIETLHEVYKDLRKSFSHPELIRLARSNVLSITKHIVQYYAAPEQSSTYIEELLGDSSKTSSEDDLLTAIFIGFKLKQDMQRPLG